MKSKIKFTNRLNFKLTRTSYMMKNIKSYEYYSIQYLIYYLREWKCVILKYASDFHSLIIFIFKYKYKYY